MAIVQPIKDGQVVVDEAAAKKSSESDKSNTYDKEMFLKIIQLSDKFINYSSFVLGILFLGCFMIRHLINSPIVQIQK